MTALDDVMERDLEFADNAELLMTHEAAAALTAMQTQCERGAYCLMEMMKAYERRIRTDCTTQEQLDKRPWECSEYLVAAKFLRDTWKPPPVSGSSDATMEGNDV